VLTYRVRNIGIAAALALLAAMFTFFYVSNYKNHVQQGEQLVDVYVASHDIPAGTSGAEVAGSLTHKRVARTAVVPGAISDPSQIKRLVATQAIFSGEQVSTKRFQPLAEQGIRGQLKGNLRAIAVPGDANQLLLGTLQDGDRIDVVSNWTYPEGQQQHVSRTILRDIKVLRAPTESKVASHLGAATNSPYAAILAVSDTQSRKLFWMMKNGNWSFELRPVTKATDSVEGFDTSESILKAGLKGRGR
jgi:Flp pilus assembly protein CpaB